MLHVFVYDVVDVNKIIIFSSIKPPAYAYTQASDYRAKVILWLICESMVIEPFKSQIPCYKLV